MLKLFVLKTRTRVEIFKGYYNSMIDCLEDALANDIDLKNLKLSGINLSQANLDGGDFTGSDFSGCNLTGANMSECILDKCLFSNALMVDMCMCETSMRNTVFYETSFVSIDVAGAVFESCLFSCPTVFGLNFQDVKLFDMCSFYYDHQYCAISKPPYVFHGLKQGAVIMDHHIMVGNVLLKYKNQIVNNDFFAKSKGAVDISDDLQDIIKKMVQIRSSARQRNEAHA